MSTRQLSNSSEWLTVQARDLAAYRMSLLRLENGEIARLVAVIDGGRTAMLAPISGAAAVELQLDDRDEFDVFPTISDGV
ncbi:hypothetical protein ACFULT_22035 [Rhodococcus sp. NPDC057297]|uniref:hypothetical protein n=1 Tax=Rhodococcus sp. NPDC057297 TaxID=3346090 RepID=UPI003639000C